MLHDDRPPALDAWLDRKLDGVASGIRHDVERWLRALKDEVTRDDIEDFLGPLHGSHRRNALVTLRSLFTFCAANRMIFRNSARGTKVGCRLCATVLQPLGQDDIDDAVATPAASACS